jgi:2-polyprenyl-3-methyl-5-hydroxy-6-metoxy-1,4-benzoquinol methylase
VEYIERRMRHAMRSYRLYEWTMECIEQHHVPGMMIDVGCSTGTQLAVAKKRGWKVLGFDLSTDLPALAWHLHRVEVRSENFLEMQERSIADIVLMSQVIAHVPDPRPFLQRSLDVLKPGGLVCGYSELELR